MIHDPPGESRPPDEPRTGIAARPQGLDLAGEVPESIRRANLRQESNVKSIGQLCYLVAFFSFLGTLEFFLFAVGVIPQAREMKSLTPPGLLQFIFWMLCFGFLINTLAQAALGFGLIHLQAWARWTVVVLTAISLVISTLMSLVTCLANPTSGLLKEVIGFEVTGVTLGLISLLVGVAFHVLILYPLLTPSTGVIFSQAYQVIVRKSPQIKSRMHWLLKLSIGFILAGVLGFLGYLLAIYFWIID